MKKLVMLLSLMVVIIIPAFAQTTEITPELEDQLTTIETFVSENRGLAILEPVTKRFITREELRALMTEQTQTSTSDAGLGQRELFYRSLGFMNDDSDFSEFYLGLMIDITGGFFPSSSDGITVILPDDMSLGDTLPLEQQGAYAHELTHALQEQHFGISTDYVFETTDKYMAYFAFVEGDAMLVMQNYLTYAVQNNLGNMNSSPSTINAVNNAPPILINEMLFRYTSGLNFVTYLRSNVGGGWDAVNDVYANLPQSTEQILQPSKYISSEAPIPVELADLSVILGDTWQHSATSTIGLFYLQEYLSQYVATGLVYPAARGWGGDTMSIYYQPDTDELAWALGITWDAPIEKEQREFSDLYTQIFEIGFDIVSETPLCGVLDGVTTCFTNTDTTTFITSAPTTDLAQALLTHVTTE